MQRVQMKTKKTWLTMIAMLLCSITASAHDFEVDGIYYNIISNEDLEVEVTYKGTSSSSSVYSGEVIIPNSVEYNGATYSVKRVGARAFYCCSNLTGITIGDFVTNIESYAFWQCYGLTSITIGDFVTDIGERAFAGCSKLPAESNIRYVGNWAVEVTDSKQTSYTLRTNTIGIAVGAFKDCVNMTNIEIPNSVRNINSSAFSGCCDLTEITIPNSVTSIGSSVFKGCI